MIGNSLNIVQDRLEKLKTCLTAVRQLFPEAITEGKIDWEKLQATLGKENLEFRNERYVLYWAGKTDAFKVLQQPSTATLKPVPEESINFETTENVFIEGENLEVLKVLQKSYYGKVKCIIIDPPYNTGSDSFIYPDSFKESKEEYQKRIGEKDEEGYLLKEGFFRKNSKDSGHYHSNWLSMMYPRLFLAKNLLRDDGVIFIHIDDNEVHNLRLIMNEIFGEENFVAEIAWQSRQSVQNDIDISTNHEYILSFAKKRRQSDRRLKESNKEKWYEDNTFAIYPLPLDESKFDNPDNDQRGLWKADPFDAPNIRPNLTYAIINPNTMEENWPPKGRCWRTDENSYKKLLADKRIIFGKEGKSKPQLKVFYNEKKEFGSIETTWFDGAKVGTATTGTKELQSLFDGISYFDTPKPTEVVKHLLRLSTKNENIILDFFAGSGTTAQAVLEQNKEDGGNRKFILVQLPEKCDEDSEAYKTGYKTIADIAKERIRRVINRLNHDSRDSKITMIKDKEQNQLFAEEKNQGNQGNPRNQGSDNGFKVFKLSSSNFKIWRGSEITEENLENQLNAFTNPVREGSEKENMLYELILKAGYLLTDKVNENKKYYSVNDGELIIALEEMNQKLIDTIISVKPKKVITLDKLFTGNDQLKTNSVLQMRDAEIDFKTI